MLSLFDVNDLKRSRKLKRKLEKKCQDRQNEKEKRETSPTFQKAELSLSLSFFNHVFPDSSSFSEIFFQVTFECTLSLFRVRSKVSTRAKQAVGSSSSSCERTIPNHEPVAVAFRYEGVIQPVPVAIAWRLCFNEGTGRK